MSKRMQPFTFSDTVFSAIKHRIVCSPKPCIIDFPPNAVLENQNGVIISPNGVLFFCIGVWFLAKIEIVFELGLFELQFGFKVLCGKAVGSGD